jgi:hypothetical protein
MPPGSHSASPGWAPASAGSHRRDQVSRYATGRRGSHGKGAGPDSSARACIARHKKGAHLADLIGNPGADEEARATRACFGAIIPDDWDHYVQHGGTAAPASEEATNPSANPGA